MRMQAAIFSYRYKSLWSTTYMPSVKAQYADLLTLTFFTEIVPALPWKAEHALPPQQYAGANT
jgi:hypothetical protein